jgi:hypothetical protein
MDLQPVSEAELSAVGGSGLVGYVVEKVVEAVQQTIEHIQGPNVR